MVVQVEQIREGGLTLTQPLAQPFLAEVLADAVQEGFQAQAAAALRASFVRTSGGVLLEGSVDLPLAAPCKRCSTANMRLNRSSRKEGARLGRTGQG